MALDASLDAALKGAAPLVCLMLKVELADHTITVLDGSGEAAFGGDTYTGEDAVFGVWDTSEPIVEQVGTEAPIVRLRFIPSSLAALASLTNPANQGARIWIWLGAIDPAAGSLTGTPEPMFFGEFDTADVEADSGRTVIDIQGASAWERLFEANEGHRLNNAFIQSVYPGALGASFVISIQRDLPWGYDAPRPAVVSDVIGGRGIPGTSPITGGGFGGGGGSTGGGDFYDFQRF